MKTICKHPVVSAGNVECNYLGNPRVCSLFQPLDIANGRHLCHYSQLVGSVCSHGSLDRSCEMCERDATIAERDARIAELEAEFERLRDIAVMLRQSQMR